MKLIEQRRKRKRFWKKRRRFKMMDVNEANLKGEEVVGWTYGIVLTRVFWNQSQKGNDYYTVRQDRLYQKKRSREVGTSKSFYQSDLEDMQHGLTRATVWLDERKRTETVLLSKWL